MVTTILLMIYTHRTGRNRIRGGGGRAAATTFGTQTTFKKHCINWPYFFPHFFFGNNNRRILVRMDFRTNFNICMQINNDVLGWLSRDFLLNNQWGTNTKDWLKSIVRYRSVICCFFFFIFVRSFSGARHIHLQIRKKKPD